jgi:hypothetical protein
VAGVRWLVFVTLVGCAYTPDSFSSTSHRFPGQHTTVGCLDISVDRRADMQDAAVLDYQFGNRCNDDVLVDLGSARVVGRTMDGTEIALVAHDPAFEIRATKLPARRVGGEAIAYPTKVQLAQVCVDAASLVEAKETRWLCFAGRAPSTPEETP